MAQSAEHGFWGHGDQGDFQPSWNRLVLQFTAGSSGAVPSTFLKKAGFEGCAKDGTGLYTATVNGIWPSFIKGTGGVLQTGGTYDPAKAFDVKVFAVDLAARTFKFATVRPDTGAAIDPASGDVVTLNLELGGETPPNQQ